MAYVRSYDAAYGKRGNTRLKANPATRAWGVLLLQLLAIGAVGWVLYVLVGAGPDGATPDEEDAAPSGRPSP
jgi:hypothetical protein